MSPQSIHDGTIDLRPAGLWLVALAGLLLASGVLVHPVDGHNYYFNINWHAGFLAELRSGTWYPRWLSTTNQGLGAPSFYFYAPLPFYVSAAIDLIWPFARGQNVAPTGAALVAVILSGLAMYALVRAFFAAVIAVPTAIVFMAMPYHFALDFWWRAAFGEIWAFVWLPLIALGVVRQAKGKASGALLAGTASAGLILSHLPSFVIGACGLAAISAVAVAGVLAGSLERGPVLRTLIAIGMAMGIAVLATTIYWYPALTTAHLTHMREYMTQGWYSYDYNFILTGGVAPANLVLNTVGFSILYAGGGAACLIILKGGARSLLFAMSLAAFGVSLFMASPLSAFLYEWLPPLQRLQFPWRFLLLAETALALLLAQAMASLGLGRIDRVPKRTGLAVIACASVLLLALAVLIPGWARQSYDQADMARIDALLKTRADAVEYRTRATDLPFHYDVMSGHREAPAAPRFIGEEGDAQLLGTRARPGHLVLNQFWYPDLAVHDRKSGRALVTSAQAGTGLALAEVPVGDYDLIVQRRALPEVVIASRISVAGVVLALLWIGLAGWKFRHRPTALGEAS